MVRIVELLILGGTVFLGRHVVDAALAAGHRVTILHRGHSPAHRPGDVEELLADRDGGLDVLAGRSWDAVVDTSGYVPRVVGDSARRLAGAVDHYVFVSSVSVYADLTGGVDEDRPLHEPPDHEDVAAAYGGLKVGCERAVEAALPGRALHVRAGLIVGPHDGTNRFTYWVTRVAAGGEVLVPDALDRPVQVVDVRDLAGWMVDAAEDRLTGTLNVMGPRGAVTFGGLLAAARAAGGPTRGSPPWTRTGCSRRGWRRGRSCPCGCPRPCPGTAGCSTATTAARGTWACASGRSRRPWPTRWNGRGPRRPRAG